MNNIQSHSRLGQQGIVSLMVTMVLMMVISLIVLGFGEISRREQRQVLDRQLSSQAFLAAETGVNDARQAIATALRASQPIPEKTQCQRTTGSDPYAAYNPVLNAATDVTYSCLLVSTRLQNVIQTVAADGGSSVVPLKPVGGQVNRLHLKWTTTEEIKPIDVARCATTIPGNGANNFPRAADWACPYGVIRIDMVPIDSLNRNQLMTNNRVVFLYPTSNAGTPTVSHAAMNGVVSAMGCTVAGCSVDITGISTAATNYAIRVVGIYKGGKLDISADNASGVPLLLSEAQAKVDATGRAAGVLRRIEARIPLTTNQNVPFTALQSGSSICKRFRVGPDMFRIPSDIVGQDSNNPLCKPLTAAPPESPLQPCVPRDIVMVLDRSDSMNTQWNTGTAMSKLQEVSRTFVQNTVNTVGDSRVGIIAFNDSASILQQLTFDKNALVSAINRMSPSGQTIYSDALNLARQHLTDNNRNGIGEAIVFVSDGAPDESGQSARNTANNLKASGVRIYTVGIDGQTFAEPDEPYDQKLLEDMAGNGGYYFDVNNETNLEDVVRKISADLSCS